MSALSAACRRQRLAVRTGRVSQAAGRQAVSGWARDVGRAVSRVAQAARQRRHSGPPFGTGAVWAQATARRRWRHARPGLPVSPPQEEQLSSGAAQPPRLARWIMASWPSLCRLSLRVAEQSEWQVEASQSKSRQQTKAAKSRAKNRPQATSTSWRPTSVVPAEIVAASGHCVRTAPHEQCQLIKSRACVQSKSNINWRQEATRSHLATHCNLCHSQPAALSSTLLFDFCAAPKFESSSGGKEPHLAEQEQEEEEEVNLRRAVFSFNSRTSKNTQLPVTVAP